MVPTCPKNGARLLLSCFVVIGFLVTPSITGFRPFEYDLIEEQSSFEFERADADDEGLGLDEPLSFRSDAPSTGSETEFETKFNEMLKARNLTGKISAEKIQRKFGSHDHVRPRPFGRIVQVNVGRVNDRLKHLAEIKLQPQNKDLFGQKCACNNY